MHGEYGKLVGNGATVDVVDPPPLPLRSLKRANLVCAPVGYAQRPFITRGLKVGGQRVDGIGLHGEVAKASMIAEHRFHSAFAFDVISKQVRTEVECAARSEEHTSELQ